MSEHVCNKSGCTRPGVDVYDYYGIFAGYWCDKHRSNAPGQWAYAPGGVAGDGTPLEEDW